MKFIKDTEKTAQEIADDWRREVKALHMMNGLKQEHIVHFITAFRRNIRRNKRDHTQGHYLMFEWAENGNLRQLWKTTPLNYLTGSLIRDVAKQLLGLASALHKAHNLNDTEASYRHGDLKPENILCFNGGGQIGTLKIGDWGIAKFHDDSQPTVMRPSGTTSVHGTRRYEAPEVDIGLQRRFIGQSLKRRSRLNDIWAMGCITLEFIIWLLYGQDGLQIFDNQMDGDSFYQSEVENGKPVARVHPVAVRWMEVMAEDAECTVGTTALGDLLELVRTGLLLVKLPRRLGTIWHPATDKGGNRADSVTSANVSTVDFATTMEDEDYSSVDDLPTAKNVPTFQFTGPDHEPPREQELLEPGKVPVPPEPEAPGPARCLSGDFQNRMDAIYNEDDSIGYWDMKVQRPRLPEELATSSNIVARPPKTKVSRAVECAGGDPDADCSYRLTTRRPTSMRTIGGLDWTTTTHPSCLMP